MSGSGSTLFALAGDRSEAVALVAKLRTMPELAGCEFRTARTLTSRVTGDKDSSLSLEKGVPL